MTAIATEPEPVACPAQRFVVVVFDGVSLGIMSFAFGVFDMAKHYGVLPDLEVRVVAGEPATAVTGGGLSCYVPYDLGAILAASLVIVPNWRDPAEPPPEPVLAALRAAHGRGARVAGLCSGAFVLAAAGLLDGRPATTHWALAGELARMYPKAQVKADQLYIDDGDVLTAGGGAAGMDLGLHLLREHCGAAVANRLARSMVVPPHRPGGQAQYIESPLPAPDDSDPVGETMTWALAHLDQPLPVGPASSGVPAERRSETGGSTMEIRPFRVAIAQESLDDLRNRLDRTRWTSDIPGEGPDYGVDLAWVRRLAGYWLDGYDWRAAEARLNAYPQFITEIDGQDIHFLHVRSPEPGALPLILTHGWPGSVVEYLDVIGPLADPRAHGRDPSIAFDLVIPSLPGFAFSSPLTGRGWGTARTAAAWAELMRRLGYQRYGAAGNDAGSMVSPEIGRLDPDHVTGVHVTQVFSFPSGDPDPKTEFEGLSGPDLAALAKLQWFMDHKFSFNQLHSQQPQTLAHALADSPAGLLAWNGQLMGEDAMGEKGLDDDFVLTNVALYWLTNTGGSSIRFYHEDAGAPRAQEPTTVPLGVAGFAGDFSGIRRFAERDHQNLVQWNMHPEPGGHYAAHLEPDVLADDIRSFYAGRR